MALTDKLTAIADAIRGKTGKTDGLTLEQMPTEIDGISVGEAITDGTGVTFGNENGVPVEREEKYSITSADLNELGRISQSAGGNNNLLTVSEMIAILDRAKFLPFGYAETAVKKMPGLCVASATGTLTEG